MTLALELPEILYRIGLYLDADQVLACSLVSKLFYNAFSPLVWKDLHFSLTKEQLKLIREKTPLARKISFHHLFESNELERDTLELVSILQDRSPWMRSLTIHQHESVQQFSSFVGPACNRVETMSIEGIPLVGEFGDQTYWKSCKTLLRQNRPDLRSLSLQNWKSQVEKPMPGQPVWNPILACTQHLNLTSLSLVRCKIRGKHLKAFWTISARLEALELEDVSMDLTWIPSSFLKDRDKDKEKESAPTAKRALPPPDLPPRFPKLQTLSIRKLGQHHPLSQFHWLILPCPSLRTLTWIFDWHRHFPTQPFMEAFKDTPASPTAWPHLDSITFKGHSNWMSDDNYHQLLTTTRQSLRRLDIVHYSIQPRSFEVLQARHFATIQTIDLTHSLPEHASKWMVVVLESCQSLERIKAKVIRGQDIIMSRPWACLALQVWAIAIDMDFDYLCTDATLTSGTGSDDSENAPTSTSTSGTAMSAAPGGTPSNTTLAEPLPIPPTTNGPKRRLTKQERQACRDVYKRFSALTRLREFDMLNSHSMNYFSTPGIPGAPSLSLSNPNHPSHRIISLPLRLNLGLAYLSRLDRLEKFCFWNGYMQVRHKEIQWILEHWKGLKRLSGGFSIPNRMIQTAYKEFSWSNVYSPILKEGGVSTEGSRYQHYDDSAEVLEGDAEAAAAAARDGDGDGDELTAGVGTKDVPFRGPRDDDDDGDGAETESDEEHEHEP